MHIALRFFLFVIAVPLFAGCSTTEQRLGNLEGQMQNVQVLDLRMSNAEERLTRVEGDLNGLRGALPPARAESGKKAGGKGKDPARVGQTPAAGAARPPYLSVHTDGRRVAPYAAVSPASPAAGKTPAPALLPVGLKEPPAAAPAKAAGTRPSRAVAPAVARSPAVTGKKTGAGEYDSALALYYKGQYGKAQESFSGFLSRHPSSNLTPNAMYWQGECLYSQDKFDSAIIIFKNLAGKYPKHPKAAAALLKAGFSYARIKDMENARFYWQILVDDFPKSEPAAIARKRLDQG